MKLEHVLARASAAIAAALVAVVLAAATLVLSSGNPLQNFATVLTIGGYVCLGLALGLCAIRKGRRPYFAALSVAVVCLGSALAYRLLNLSSSDVLRWVFHLAWYGLWMFTAVFVSMEVYRYGLRISDAQDGIQPR